jgi:hypothetical protein
MLEDVPLTVMQRLWFWHVRAPENYREDGSAVVDSDISRNVD